MKFPITKFVCILEKCLEDILYQTIFFSFQLSLLSEKVDSLSILTISKLVLRSAHETKRIFKDRT